MDSEITSTERTLIVKGKEKIALSAEIKKIRVEENASLELSIREIKENIQLEIVVEKNAKLNLKELYQDDKQETINILVRVKENGSVVRQVANFCSGESRTDFECILEGEGAEVSDTEIHFGSKNSSTVNNLTVDHKKSNTKSTVRIKGAFKDRSKNNTYGLIKVEKGTVNANASLSAHALILDKEAQALAIPALEIESAEVQASHAASVSTVDEEQLFYVTSRGLSNDQAKKEIVKGFLIDLVCEKEFEELIEERWK